MVANRYHGCRRSARRGPPRDARLARCVLAFPAMRSDLRAAFNAAFTPARYARYTQRLQEEVGEVPFRLAESPVFATDGLRDFLFRACNEILEQLAEPERLRRAQAAIPAGMSAPNQPTLPNVMTVDFAIVQGEHGLEGRVVELQAFPSLYCFSLVQGRVWSEMLEQWPGIERGFTPIDPELDFEGALRITREAILGGNDPEEVVLLEIEPDKQKTRCDFVATRKLVGIDAVCVTKVKREGRRLFREKGGRLVPIKRVYNRVVFDELHKKSPPMAFSMTDDLDVTFCTHPNWYWLWSKFSLPLLDHPAVPKATLLSELKDVPEDLGPYVLKPLFSYAGAGVKVDPTRADVDAVPEDQRGGWVLQRKITYARDTMRSPEGNGIAGEVRMLCFSHGADPLPRPFMNLVRLSRGKMLGIDFNKDLDWVGSSLLMWPTK